jgi:hypothetical protein
VLNFVKAFSGAKKKNGGFLYNSPTTSIHHTFLSFDSVFDLILLNDKNGHCSCQLPIAHIHNLTKYSIQLDEIPFTDTDMSILDIYMKGDLRSLSHVTHDDPPPQHTQFDFNLWESSPSSSPLLQLDPARSSFPLSAFTVVLSHVLGPRPLLQRRVTILSTSSSSLGNFTIESLFGKFRKQWS